MRDGKNEGLCSVCNIYINIGREITKMSLGQFEVKP